jgi:DNA-directed RNA polymerase specialized sigma24 family protein
MRPRRRSSRPTAPSGRTAATELDEAAGTVAHAPDPLREALAAEERDAVRDAVAALPEPYREVVALRFFADLSLADIASATGRPAPSRPSSIAAWNVSASAFAG